MSKKPTVFQESKKEDKIVSQEGKRGVSTTMQIKAF